MFIDEVILDLEAGDGGNGCLAFRREKFVEMGGPDGGNGGSGSNIIFKVDEGLNTLIDLRKSKLIKGKKGANGTGKTMHGKGAEDIIVKVPLGTVITDVETGNIICDLTYKDDEFIVAKGGRGGRGNAALRTRNETCPNYAENGEPGDSLRVKVELKLLADVGLVGLPSVGKSTIISKISASKPKIADYHFTTLHPNLGVVRASNNRSFVVADLPGLIEGASEGVGLGHKFLRHIERTRVIAHVVDMSNISGVDPVKEYKLIREELGNFSEKLLDKKEIIIANKMDMEGAKENLVKFKKEVNSEVYEISAIKGEGLDKVVEALANILDDIKKEPLYDSKELEKHVLYKFKEEETFNVTKENNYFLVTGPKVYKLLKMTNFNTDEAALRFAHQLSKLGVDEELIRLGAKDGDTVKVYDIQFEWKRHI
jgi:GTP-binding protein